MDFFRGFVKTKNKKSQMAFKDVPTDLLLTYEQAQELSEYAGVLADDTILIDIDDFDASEKLMKIVEKKELICRVYETTHGKHFVFKNIGEDGHPLQNRCITKKYLACGIIADIKVGHKNSLEVLKFDGKERPIIYDKLDDEEYQAVPKYLLPVRSRMEFITMKEGDGRNQALFNYILTLQSHDFSIEECRECITLINECVLADPLPESEIETILRDEAFSKPAFFNKKGAFLFDKFAHYMVSNSHIIKVHGQLHIYSEGVYVPGQKFIESEMIKHLPGLSQAKRKEVMSYLDVLIRKNTKPSEARYIAFQNGIYDIETDTLQPFSPDLVVTNKINFNYNPDAYSDIADKVLGNLSCHDKYIRELLEEVAGYVMYRRNELRKAFIFTGLAAAGKSTYLDMIKTMLGDENTVALDLKELGDRFKTAEIFGKLAIIGDDIGDEFIPNPAIFRKLTSGDRVNVEQKGKDPFDFNSYAKPLFSANDIPRIKDKSGAVTSRLIIVPFKAEFSADDPNFDPYIKYKLREPECMEYLIKIGIQGLKNVLKNRKFTISEEMQQKMDEYEENNNPVLLFFKEEEPEIENQTTAGVYKKYQAFCIANSFTPLSNIEFSKQVKKTYKVEIIGRKVNGKKSRVFVKRGC